MLNNTHAPPCDKSLLAARGDPIYHWRIYIVKLWTHALPPPRASKFFQFYAVFGRIWQNDVFTPPPPHEGSRPQLGKSWIRHCIIYGKRKTGAKLEGQQWVGAFGKAKRLELGRGTDLEVRVFKLQSLNLSYEMTDQWLHRQQSHDIGISHCEHTSTDRLKARQTKNITYLHSVAVGENTYYLSNNYTTPNPTCCILSANQFNTNQFSLSILMRVDTNLIVCIAIHDSLSFIQLQLVTFKSVYFPFLKKQFCVNLS